nr:hypothetical protein [Tanacetum cinerariifolium]
EEDKETGKGGDELEKVKVKVMKKKLDKRKTKLLIRFPEHLKKVRRKVMMRRSRI